MTVIEGLDAGLIRSAESLWVPPAGGYFEGRWQNGRRHLHVYDPEDGSLVGVALDASDAEVDRAVRFVAAGHAKVHWPLWQRRESLEAVADRLSDATELFTVLIAAEGCKTATEAACEVARAVEVLRLCAQLSSLLTGRTVPFDDTPRGAGWRGWFTREPVGVVAAITPFNDPLNLVVHKLGPAPIAGNAVVLKPAPATPPTALAFGQILLASGVPGELLAILPGTETGRALVSHPLVDVVSFTGGSATADHIAQSGRARKLLMELGGNNAVLVCADTDIDEVAEAIVDGAFGVAGQNCLSVQRVIVHASRYDNLVAQVTKRAAALVVGSKQDPRTELGPLINQIEARRVVDWVHQAVLAGGRLRTGASLDGSFVTPAVLTDVPSDARVWTDEVFGPVVVIRPYVEPGRGDRRRQRRRHRAAGRSLHLRHRPGPGHRRPAPGGGSIDQLDFGRSDRRDAVRRLQALRHRPGGRGELDPVAQRAQGRRHQVTACRMRPVPNQPTKEQNDD